MKIKFIINSGISEEATKEVIKAVNDNFGEHFYSLEFTGYHRHAEDIARSSASHKFDIVVAAGGDGTVNEVINGIAGSDTSLAVLPVGTANDFAGFYSLPHNLHEACRVIKDGKGHYPDLILVNGTYYATAGGIGFPTKVVRLANKLKSLGMIGNFIRELLGSKLYILSVLISLMRKNAFRSRINLSKNGLPLNMNAFSLMIDNQPLLGGNLQMSPGAVNDDGAFNICLIEGMNSRTEVVRLLLRIIKGQHLALSNVLSWSAKELEVESEKEEDFFGDGDLLCHSNKFKMEVVQGALRVIVPKHFQNSVTKVQSS
jgi:YegS/Rv2252/BmrU family lipid kinase